MNKTRTRRFDKNWDDENSHKTKSLSYDGNVKKLYETLNIFEEKPIKF